MDPKSKNKKLVCRVLALALGKSHLCRVLALNTRQRAVVAGNLQKKFKKKSLPSAGSGALGKEIWKKKRKIFCRVPDQGHSAKKFEKKNKKFFAECRARGTRQRNLKKKTLPSAGPGALGKEI